MRYLNLDSRALLSEHLHKSNKKLNVVQRIYFQEKGQSNVLSNIYPSIVQKKETNNNKNTWLDEPFHLVPTE